jgi:low affinity Fe/Cu permease
MKRRKRSSQYFLITQGGGTFHRFARFSARMAGHPGAFGAAVGILILWVAMGPIFGFSDSWQLVINTATTIVTFLMVFLIQNTQNRDSEAMHLKLDELLRATGAAHNALLDIEELSEDELDRIKEHYERLARQAREALRAGRSDLGQPDMNKPRGNHSHSRPDTNKPVQDEKH